MKKLFFAVVMVMLAGGNAICAWAQEPIKNNPPATEQRDENKSEESKSEEPAQSDAPSTDAPQNNSAEGNAEQAR